MFRMLVLQALNNLSDEQVEYQVRDRLLGTRYTVGTFDNVGAADEFSARDLRARDSISSASWRSEKTRRLRTSQSGNEPDLP